MISVPLPAAAPGTLPSNAFQVVSRCFQILQDRLDDSWRRETDLVIAPDVRGVAWNAFGLAPRLIQAGEAAALAAPPTIEEWFTRAEPAAAPRMPLRAAAVQ